MPAALALRAAVDGTVEAQVDDSLGRQAVVVRSTSDRRRGALSAADGDTIALAARTARQSGVPLVLVLASSGADVIDGVDALVGWGRAAKELVACSGIVPILAALVGPAVSGPALLLGVADIVVMTPSSYAYVSGPRMVRQMTGAMISSDELGGVSAHQRSTGVAARVVPMEEVDDALADLLAYLPDSNDDEPPRWPMSDPVDRATPDAGAILPAESTAGYDVRSVIRSIVDDDEFLELRELYAPNLVTGFATVDGRPVGIVANQPQQLAGTLDITCSHKGARFVSFCDAFNLPLVTLVDTSGFYPGKDMEWRGMIRHGAQLAFAYARATVPRVGLTLRKSYGGAFIVMDSKTMGCDLHLAWPSAEIAVMGAEGAVGILHRRTDPAERPARVVEYEEQYLNPWIAAERGYIDAVIDPADTRRELCAALEVLSTKRELLAPRRHDNLPL
ncbi:MAG: carboxyl transferase domain-containing protein [Acidimicrobiales bacterium]